MQRDFASHVLGVMRIAMVAHAHSSFSSLIVGSGVNKEPQMKIVVRNWYVLLRLAQRFGPYLLVEAVMPGGTLLALLLYLYRAPRGS
jgi:hypothetical protein